MKTTMILTTLMLLAFTASAEDVAPEPFVLMLFPHFLEMVDNFDSRDACVARGIEMVNSADIFNGFACEHGRAWIAASEVAVKGAW